MQSLDVISVNLWNIVISLCNLLVMFFILKRFLYKPVQRVISQRQAMLDEQYDAADRALKAAQEDRTAWQLKLEGAQTEADGILKDAALRADRRSERIVGEAREKADSIMRDAELQAALEYKKAQAGIKQEIVDVSALLAEKLLEREINTEDHRMLIDSVISEIGENND